MVSKSGSNVVRVKTTTIEAAIKKLEAAPQKQKEEHTLRESIELMKDAIKGILERGYTYDEVAAMLSESGITISGATLKQYMTALTKKKRTTKSSSRKATGASKAKNSDPDGSVNRNAQVTEHQQTQEIVEEPSTDSSSSKGLAKMAKTAKLAKGDSGNAEDEFNH